MSKGNTFENDLLKLIFQATAIANIADNAATSPLTNLYVSLHTADPGEAGDQTTSETAYTNYARQAVARTSGGWAVTNNRVDNVSAITFPQCGASGSTVMFWVVGTSVSGAGKQLYRGPFGSVLGPFRGNASDDVVTIEAHGLSVDDRIAFFAGVDGVLPTGVTEGTVYYVGTAPSADTITLSTTAANANPVNITADGDGYAMKVVPLTISNGITPQIAAGALDIDED